MHHNADMYGQFLKIGTDVIDSFQCTLGCLGMRSFNVDVSLKRYYKEVKH